MTLDTYQHLIKNLPVQQQSFRTKRENWKKAEDSIYWLPEINDKLFLSHNFLEISRQDIISTDCSIQELIIQIIYWGYPNGMRGNHFVNILSHMEQLITVLTTLKDIEEPNEKDFKWLVHSLKNIQGLGMSTFSKILYFMGIKFNGNFCLILDQRLIDVFRNNTFKEFNELSSVRYDSTTKHFLNYLRIINQLAVRLGTKGENIEQFLFLFGNNLKE